MTFLVSHGEICHPHGWSTWQPADQPTTRRPTWPWGFKENPYKKSMWVSVLWAGLEARKIFPRICLPKFSAKFGWTFLGWIPTQTLILWIEGPNCSENSWEGFGWFFAWWTFRPRKKIFSPPPPKKIPNSPQTSSRPLGPAWRPPPLWDFQ